MALKTTCFLPFIFFSISFLDREITLFFLNFNSSSFILNYLKKNQNILCKIKLQRKAMFFLMPQEPHTKATEPKILSSNLNAINY